MSFQSNILKGNSYFSNGIYLAALSYYLSALNKNEDNSRVYLNLSAVYLKLSHFNQAYNFASKVVELGETNSQKAFFRMGIAAYKMGQFEKSAKKFQQCLDINPSNNEAQVKLKLSEERIKESQTGEYDFEKLTENIKNQIMEMDVSDFKSNHIKVVYLKDNYKGVIATTPIKKGTLLVASKAIATSFHDKNDSKTHLDIDNTTKKSRDNEASKNSIKVIRKMQGNPTLAKEIYDLYAGDSNVYYSCIFKLIEMEI